jgi:hypothetical protein
MLTINTPAYTELLRLMDLRAARGVAPHTSELRILGDPFSKRWAKHGEVLVRALDSYEDPGVNAPYCWLGLCWHVLGKPISEPLTYAQIAAKVGIDWNIAAGMVALNDAGMEWGAMADALRTWQLVRGFSMVPLQSRTILYDLKRRLEGAGLLEALGCDYGLDVLEEAAFKEQCAEDAHAAGGEGNDNHPMPLPEKPPVETPQPKPKPSKKKAPAMTVIVVPFTPKPAQAERVIA